MKKPKLNSNDWFYVFFGVAWATLVCYLYGVLAFACLAGCAVEERSLPDVRPQAPPNLVGAPPSLALDTLYVSGPFIRVEEDNIHCLMADERVDLYLDRLASPHPRVYLPLEPQLLPQAMLLSAQEDGETIVWCDPLKDYTTMWGVTCQARSNGIIGYQILYDLYVDQFRWDEKEYFGWYTLTIDGGPHFWCSFWFNIDTAAATYIWR